jgi:hypothetical protein
MMSEIFQLHDPAEKGVKLADIAAFRAATPWWLTLRSPGQNGFVVGRVCNSPNELRGLIADLLAELNEILQDPRLKD